MSILQQIFEYPFLIKIFDKLLTDKEKINVISVNKYINQNKRKLKFYNKKRCIPSQWKYWYFDCLVKIEIYILFRLPESLKYLKIHIIDEAIDEGDIPKSVTHFHIENTKRFYSNIIIPNHISHLYFKYLSCNDNLGDYVTHLEIGDFNYFEFCVPKSIIYLKISSEIRIINSQSLIHLEFGDKILKPLSYFTLNTPNLIEITVGKFYGSEMINEIPNFVKRLNFKGKLYTDYLSNLKNVTHLKIIKCHNLNFPSHLKISYYDEIDNKSVAKFEYN